MYEDHGSDSLRMLSGITNRRMCRTTDAVQYNGTESELVQHRLEVAQLVGHDMVRGQRSLRQALSARVEPYESVALRQADYPRSHRCFAEHRMQVMKARWDKHPGETGAGNAVGDQSI